MRRYYDKMTFYEPKSQKADHTNNPISDHDREIIEIMGRHDHIYTDADDCIFKNMQYGKEYKWDKSAMVSLT